MLSGHDFLFLQTAALKMLCIYFFQNIVTTYEYFWIKCEKTPWSTVLGFWGVCRPILIKKVPISNIPEFFKWKGKFNFLKA